MYGVYGTFRFIMN